MNILLLEELFKNWEAVSWCVEGSSGVSKGKGYIGHHGLVESGQQLYQTEPEGHSQSGVVWLEEHNNGINLIVAGKKGQAVVDVLIVLLKAP